MHVLFSLSRIMCGLLLWIVLSSCACRFHSIVTLPLELLPLILVHVRTTVFCPVAPLFPCICCSVFVLSLNHAALHIVLLPVLDMLILYGLLSHHVVGTVCICYSSLCVVYHYYYYYYYYYECVQNILTFPQWVGISVSG
jgi:hypothetical protein